MDYNRITGHRRHIYILLLLSVLYGIIFFWLNTLQYRSFFSFEWEDDACQNQLFYNIAKYFNPRQTIFYGGLFCGDHFTPIYFIPAIIYRIFPYIYTYYGIISSSYALCALLVYLLAVDIIKDRTVAFLLGLSYLFYSPLHYLTLNGLSPDMFSLPLLFLTFYFTRRGKFAYYLICAAVTCMTREDIVLVVFGLGLYQRFKGYPAKWWKTTVLGCVLYFFAANGISNFYNSGYCPANINTFKEIVDIVKNNSFQALDMMFSWHKIMAFILILWPVLFLPLFSCEFYIPLAIIVIIFCPNQFLYNEDGNQLSSLIPFIFIALMFSLRKIKNKFKDARKSIYISILIFTLCLISIFSRNLVGRNARELMDDPYMNYGKIYDMRFYDMKNIFDRKRFNIDEEDRRAWSFIRTIPPEASVLASGHLLPALSSRKEVYEFGLNIPEATEFSFYLPDYNHYDVDYILIDRKCLINGVGGHYAFVEGSRLDSELDKLIKDYGYVILREDGGLILLKKRESAL